MRKLSDRLADWTAHVCREDDDAFKQVLQTGMDFDEGLLHLDAVKETAWKKYLDEKQRNSNVKPPKRDMSMNWLKPLTPYSLYWEIGSLPK